MRETRKRLACFRLLREDLPEMTDDHSKELVFEMKLKPRTSSTQIKFASQSNETSDDIPHYKTEYNLQEA
jgi:hypothetical protein